MAIVLAWGWRRAAIAFVAGALSALAMAPFNAWPVLFLTFPVAGLADRRRRPPGAGAACRRRRSRLVVWLRLFRRRTLLDRLRVSGRRNFGWLLPVAVSGLPAGLALFTALGLRGGAHALDAASGAFWRSRCLTVAEWLRGHVLTGFPWNAFGYALTRRSRSRKARHSSACGVSRLLQSRSSRPRPSLSTRRAAGRGSRRSSPPIIVALAAFGAARLRFQPTHSVRT